MEEEGLLSRIRSTHFLCTHFGCRETTERNMKTKSTEGVRILHQNMSWYFCELFNDSFVIAFRIFFTKVS